MLELAEQQQKCKSFPNLGKSNRRNGMLTLKQTQVQIKINTSNYALIKK